MDRWVVVQHVAWEGPGLIAAEAESRGIVLDVRRMDRGDPLPQAEEIGGVVVMGGPMGVYEVEKHPCLAEEQALLRSAVDRRVPVLGVCLGAQLLAAALGARVFRGPSPEIGFGTVSLTPHGEADPVLGPERPAFDVLHWHRDTFDLPAGAIHLAGSAAYPNQAFRFGERAYAFQFHIEVTAAMRPEWAARLPGGILMEEARRSAVEVAGRRILGRFFDAARGVPSEDPS